MYLTKADEDKETVHKAAILAPIMDRMGRLISDFSPQLNNIVRQSQLKAQDEIRNLPNVSISTGQISSSD